MTTAVRMRRREMHAAKAQSFSPDGAKQILMAYRGNRDAAVAPGFEFKPGFIYTQVRAISARINQNFDGWPSGELKKSYRSFLGKPCFVNHQNFDPKKARGKVVAARYVEAGDDKYVETVMEIDAQRFPKLAKEIKEGGLDSVSMGVEAGFTICSYCGNKAVDVPEFCEHVKYHKGQRLGRINEKTGAVEPVMVYERCYKLGFFELSYVFDPADETAVVSRVIAAATNTPGVGGANFLSGVEYGDAPTGTALTTPRAMNTQGGAAGDVSLPPDLDAQAAAQGAVRRPQTASLSSIEARIQHLAQDPTMTAPGSIVPGTMPTNEMPTELPPTELPSTGQMPTAGRHEGPKDHPILDFFSPHESPEWQPLPEDYAPKHVKQKHHPAPHEFLEAAITRLAYGEVEAPEDVDTLRDEDDDDNDDFKHYVESPRELRGPNLDQTKRLDRDQESEGLDSNRRVEDVEDISGPPTQHGPIQQGVPMSNRNARRRVARPRYAEGDPMMDPAMGGPPPDDGSGGDPSMGAPPPDGGGAPPQSDEELIAEAEQDLQMAQAQEAGGDEGPPPDDGSGDEGPPSDEDDGGDGGFPPSDEGDEDTGDEGPPPDDGGDEEDGGDLPPWLTGGGGGDEEDAGPPPPPELTANYSTGNRHSSTPNKRRTTKGTPMSLAQRQRVAAAQRPRHHYADDSGHFDGGPYDENNQGEQEEVFLSQTPSAEAVSAPTPGDGTISNTENNLVASLSKRIQARNAEQRRDLIAYEQITGRRISAEAVESPDEVNPSVNTGAAGEELTGDSFESLGEEPTETQPRDASVRAFRAFDSWLTQTTGRTARQHGNSNFIRREAARYCSAKGWDPAVMFPALGIVLREARRSESTNRRSAMKRQADESLDVAAPQDRIDVEAPVKDTTDADAQASQFDLGDFGSNAGDNLADPDLSVDSQIWAPGEGDSSTKTSNRKADGITAVRYAEAYIRAGLAPNTPDEKWKIAGLAQTMRLGTIRDRIALLDAVNTQRAASSRRTAGINRGGGGSVPPGFGQRQLTAGTAREAANDISTDSAMFLK